MGNSDSFLLKCGLKLLLAVVAAAALAPLYRRESRKAKWLLRGWAATNGFKILQSEQCSGPYPWWLSNNRPVFRVRVRDRNGEERCGWARCGSFLGGVLFGNRVEVRWEAK